MTSFQKVARFQTKETVLLLESQRELSNLKPLNSARRALVLLFCQKVRVSHYLLGKEFHHVDTFKRAAVPKKDEKPIMGLVSDKNYIVANAVENILAGKLKIVKLSAPKLPVNKDKDYLKKKTYGNCPKYL